MEKTKKKFYSVNYKIMVIVILGTLVSACFYIGSYIYAMNKVSKVTQVVVGNQILSEVKNGIKSNVQTMVTTMEALYKEKQGKIPDKELIAEILSKIDSARYGTSGYFYVYQNDGIRLVAPENQSMVGKNLWNTKDAKGMPVIQDVIRSAKAGGDYSSYIWLNPGTKKNETKISYTSPIKLGGTELAIGTGSYIPMIQVAKDNVNSAVSKSNMSMLYIILILVVIISCLILFLIKMYMDRSLSKPLNKIVKMLQEMGKGHLEMRLHIDRNDEIGIMGKTMDGFAEYLQEDVIGTIQKISLGDLNIETPIIDEKDEIGPALKRTVTSLKGLVYEINLLNGAAIEGKLEVRADKTKYHGEYGKIIEGINKTLDAVVGPLNMSADYMDKISKGNIPEKITDEYNGDFNTIKNNLNNCIDNINAMIADTNILAQSAVEGKLEVRADESKHSGDFKNIITGFNNTLNSITEPLNEARQVMNRLSVNDYTIKMNGIYKGNMKEFAEEINEVYSRLTDIQEIFIDISMGDTSGLADFLKTEQRSEADKIRPSIIATLTSIEGLINVSGRLAEAGINGTLDVRGDASKFEGGYREIISGFNKTIDAIEKPINEASEVLEKMADGNLVASMEGDYLGSYAIIKESINSTVKSFNEILGNINNSADQVSTGSKQVSYGSQALSQGATEQASSIEQLTSSITQVAAQTKENALNANKANELALLAKENAEQGNTQMKGMLKSMQEINESSSGISKIIKVIDDIAFQTNILALNAAIEAARAGQAGKGFAVVAEEVRSLSARSAEAAKKTSELIENSIKKVEAGTKIAIGTAKSLDEIVAGVAKAADIVGNIATASNEQATAISQINKGIEQVSQVIQTNSATAEESAAASQQLSSQAELLKNMIGNFSLKKDNSSYSLDESKEKNIKKLTTNVVVTNYNSLANGNKAKSIISLNDKEFGKY